MFSQSRCCWVLWQYGRYGALQAWKEPRKIHHATYPCRCARPVLEQRACAHSSFRVDRRKLPSLQCHPPCSKLRRGKKNGKIRRGCKIRPPTTPVSPLIPCLTGTICFSCYVYYFSCIFSWGILPLQSCWSLDCDHVVDYGDEFRPRVGAGKFCSAEVFSFFGCSLDFMLIIVSRVSKKKASVSTVSPAPVHPVKSAFSGVRFRRSQERAHAAS